MADYKFTQQSGSGWKVNTADKADAYQDTNELRAIVDELGRLLGHSKKNGSFPEDGTAGGTLTAKLSAFAATTSAELAGVISDETGTDKLVYNTSPVLVTPTLGVASVTTMNGVYMGRTYLGTNAVPPNETRTITVSMTRGDSDALEISFGMFCSTLPGGLKLVIVGNLFADSYYNITEVGRKENTGIAISAITKGVNSFTFTVQATTANQIRINCFYIGTCAVVVSIA